ncbi:hypothetical protein Lal_00024214 [Lupinus albus]|nr:hypothetical protein Lal_00024214 [Lupinus albus]
MTHKKQEHFLGRPIFAPKYGNVSNFELDDFHFPILFRQQTLFAFCEESNAYYPEVVKVFYCNLNLRKNRLTSSLKGKEIIIDFATLLETKLATLLEPKFATMLQPKLATLLEPKFATLLEPKLATLLEPKFATLLEPKLATYLSQSR